MASIILKQSLRKPRRKTPSPGGCDNPLSNSIPEQVWHLLNIHLWTKIQWAGPLFLKTHGRSKAQDTVVSFSVWPSYRSTLKKLHNWRLEGQLCGWYHTSVSSCYVESLCLELGHLPTSSHCGSSSQSSESPSPGTLGTGSLPARPEA